MNIVLLMCFLSFIFFQGCNHRSSTGNSSFNNYINSNEQKDTMNQDLDTRMGDATANEQYHPLVNVTF